MTAPDPRSPEEARAIRIAELQRRVQRRPTGVQLPLAIVCLGASLFFLARQVPAVAYFVAAREPVTLGGEGAYALDRLRPNVFAQIHGVPTRTALYGEQLGARFALVGLQDTPVVVRRALLSTEPWQPGKPAPPPDPRPFGVRGRLQRLEDVPALRDSAARLRTLAGLRAADGRVWILSEGERPGEDRGALLVALLLLGFAGLNVVLAFQGFRALAARRARPEDPDVA